HEDQRADRDRNNGFEECQTFLGTHQLSPTLCASTSPISDISRRYLPSPVLITNSSGSELKEVRSTLPGGVKLRIGFSTGITTVLGRSYRRSTLSLATSTSANPSAVRFRLTVSPRDDAAVAPCQTLCWNVATAPLA